MRSWRIRQDIRAHGGHPVIPARKNRRHPEPYDREVGKLRHRVENFFARIKRFRRVATRYDQLPQTYTGFLTLAAISDWVLSGFVHAA